MKESTAHGITYRIKNVKHVWHGLVVHAYNTGKALCQGTSRLARHMHEAITQYQEHGDIPATKLMTIDNNIRDCHKSSPVKHRKHDSENRDVQSHPLRVSHACIKSEDSPKPKRAEAMNFLNRFSSAPPMNMSVSPSLPSAPQLDVNFHNRTRSLSNSSQDTVDEPIEQVERSYDNKVHINAANLVGSKVSTHQQELAATMYGSKYNGDDMGDGPLDSIDRSHLRRSLSTSTYASKNSPASMVVQEEIFEVSGIEKHERRGDSLWFSIRWKGYPSTDNSWRSEADCDGCGNILQEYKTAHNLTSLSDQCVPNLSEAPAEDIPVPLNPAPVPQPAPPVEDIPVPLSPAPVPQPPNNDGYPNPWQALMDLNGEIPCYDQPTALPNDDQLWTDLLPQLLRLHLASRPLTGLAPVERWNKPLLSTWTTAMSEFAPTLNRCLDIYAAEKNDLLLLQCAIALHALPGHILPRATSRMAKAQHYSVEIDGLEPFSLTTTGPVNPESDDPIQSISSPDPGDPCHSHDDIIKRAATKIRGDRISKAAKLLTKPGVAPSNSETANILREMHLDYLSELQTHEPIGPQIHIDPTECAKHLGSLAGSKTAPWGFYGWNDEFLRPIRKKSLDQPDNFMMQMGRFVSLLTNATIPDAVAWMTTCGSLVAANKLEAHEQLERKAAGLKAKLRPINNGSNMLKKALNIATSSTSCKRVKKNLLPQQMGLGVSGGPEKVAFLARVAYNSGYAINIEDAINGFNALKRQRFHDGTKELWPEGISLTNKFYAKDSPVIFIIVKPDGTLAIIVFRSKEGTRMGCPVASLGFDVSLDFVYKTLSDEFPSFIIKALTDDMPVFIPPPSGDETWTSVLMNLRRLLKRYDELANPIGIFRGIDKGHCLLPPDVQIPVFPESDLPVLRITQHGIKLSGAHIGTDNYVITESLKHVDTVIKRIDAVVRLATPEPQMGIRLLVQCANHSLDYYCRVTPPHLLEQAAIKFDRAIDEGLLACLTPEDLYCPKYDPVRNQRAILLARLPNVLGGLELIPTSTKSLAGFASALIACGTMRFPPDVQDALCELAITSHHSILHTLNLKEISPGHPLSDCLPIEAKDMVLGTWARNFKLNNPRLRVHSVIANCISRYDWQALRQHCSWLQREDRISKADLGHILCVSSRSQLTRVFSSSLWYREMRIEASTFIAWCRYYLNLPQMLTQRNPPLEVGKDTEQDLCRVSHDKIRFLDPTGSHAIGCVSTNREIMRCHDLLRDLLAKYARECGIDTLVEPPTSTVLADAFSPAECRAMFSSTSDDTDKLLAKEMISLSEQLLKSSSRSKKAELQAKATELTQRVANRHNAHKRKGLRVDLLLTHGSSQFLVDVTVRNITSDTYAKKACNWFRDVLIKTNEANSNGLPDPFHLQNSPVLMDAVKEKTKKYSPLVNLTDLQHAMKRRPLRPKFLVPVITHSGEWSADLFRIIEFICSTGKQLYQVCTDGVTKKAFSASLRTKLKDHSASHAVRSMGKILRSAGYPLQQAGFAIRGLRSF
jgi:hypothetical protein